jgi:glycosyltransferase involved in cell wall biosynthesis
MEYRPFYLGREWLRLGHAVTIVAASHSHVRTQAPVFEGDLGQENVDGLTYLWLRTPAYQGNGARRAINIFAFVGQLLRYRQRILDISCPDVVIASSTYPLDNYPAHLMARRANARLVYEVHDLWPLSPIELGGMSPGHPFILVMQWAENFAYHHADRVVSMLPKAASHMQAHGMFPEKFVYIPNGICLDEWQAQTPLPPSHKNVLQFQREKGHLLVGYTGAHGVANALESFIEAAQQCAAQPITFVLVGQGPEKSRLQEMAAARGLENVVFLPSVPKSVIPALLDSLDVLYIGLQKQSLFRFGVSPNKLMDYMMAGKPVIYAIEAGNDMVAESGCGISIPAENPLALAEAAIRLLNMSETDRSGMGNLGKQYVMQHHEYAVLAQDFLKGVCE